MDKSGIIISVENFKFSVFDSVPKPGQDTAYILYKEGDRTEHILVITDQHPVLSSQIRAGRYDKKMSIQTSGKKISISKQISDDSGNFKFIVSIMASYRISDVAYVFRNKLWNIEAIIENIIIKLIEEKHKKYDIESQIELQNDLRNELHSQMGKLVYLETSDMKVSVELDERAKKIIDSNLDTMADAVLLQNESDKASVEVEQRKRIEIQKLEAEKTIEEKKSAVRLEKAKGLNAIKDEIGEDFATFLAYANGEINSIEYDERIQKNRNANMMARLAGLKQLVDLDVLSGPALENAALKLLGEETAEKKIETKAITADMEEKSDIVIEDAEEY